MHWAETAPLSFAVSIDFSTSSIQQDGDKPTESLHLIRSELLQKKRLRGQLSRVHLSVEKEIEGAGRVDEALRPYLESADEDSSQDQLQRLIEQIAKPIILPIVHRGLRSNFVREGYDSYRPNAQDIQGDAVVKIIQRLRAFKADPVRQSIASFAGLVAAATYTALADRRRGRHRERAILERKIRRLFVANADLAIWKERRKNLVCGYAAWRLERPRTTEIQSFFHTQLDVLELTEEVLADTKKSNTAELILFLLGKIGRPIRLSDLINLIDQLLEAQILIIDDSPYAALTPTSFQSDTLTALETRRLLKRLFTEIQHLSLEQRKSLLLNMTDSYGHGIEWFLFANIAAEEQLASLLELSVDEFKRLLNDLPMSDKQIAKHLGISATKVKNMRRSVRERLERRRGAFLKGTPEFRRLK